jgi:hypothetical protein
MMGRKKKKELDKLSLDMIECEKAGFGCHYGRWKATQQPAKIIPVAIPDGWKACEFCGKPFKRTQGKRFCDLYCRNKAYAGKKRQNNAAYEARRKANMRKENTNESCS